NGEDRIERLFHALGLTRLTGVPLRIDLRPAVASGPDLDTSPTQELRGARPALIRDVGAQNDTCRRGTRRAERARGCPTPRARRRSGRCGGYEPASCRAMVAVLPREAR